MIGRTIFTAVCLFFTGAASSIGGESGAANVKKAEVVSVGLYSIVKEPDSCYHVRTPEQSFRKNAHMPFMVDEFFWLIKHVDPRNYFDRNIWVDAYDILVGDVRIKTPAGGSNTLPLVLLRHVTYFERPYLRKNDCVWTPISAAVLGQTTVCAHDEKFETRTELHYNDVPLMLSAFTGSRDDVGKTVRIGEMRLFLRRTHRLEGAHYEARFDPNGGNRRNILVGGRWVRISEGWKELVNISGVYGGSCRLVRDPWLKRYNEINQRCD